MATENLNVTVSAEVKEALSADSAERGVNLNDIAVGILASRFGVAFHGTGRRGPGTHTRRGPLVLRIPRSLDRRIHIAAYGRTKEAVVEDVLRQHYGLGANGRSTPSLR
jgi:hypothetical protein